MQAPDESPALPHDVRVRRRVHAGAALLTTLVALCGCAADSIGAPPISNTTRVIVRFAPDVVDPVDPAFLAALAASARVGRIELVRPMSGESYVMRIACDDAVRRPATDACDAAIARVGAISSVVMIEADGRETTR